MAIVLGCAAVLFCAAQVQLRVVLHLPSEEIRAGNFVVPLSLGVVFGVLLAAIRELAVRDRHHRARLAEREQALEVANRNLESKVGDRTRALESAHQQLLHAQRLEVVGKVAGGVAHDFNNMLTVVFACLESLDSAAQQHPSIGASLTELRAACDRARQITRQMLIFSRKDAPRTEAVDLRALLDGVLPMMRRLAGGVTTIDVDIADTLTIRCDRGQLEQVLVNLVANARDAGARRVRLTGERVDGMDAGGGEAHSPTLGSARISVADDGVGMSPETLQRATEPFFTTKPAGRGTGLGLSVAHNVVGALGGALAIASVEGKGTTISILLPLARAAMEPVSSRPAPERRGPQVVLLVEDDAVVRRTVLRLLQAAGYEVLEADSVAKAHEAIAMHGARLSALLTDLRLLDGSGTTVIKQLASAHPSVPVMAMTGYLEDADRLELGAVPVLPKPFSTKELLARLQALIERR